MREVFRMTKTIGTIERLQSGKEGTPAYMIGLQLIDMIKADGEIASILEEDLQNPDMGLEKCADALKKHADGIHGRTKGNCVCITPMEAEKIIRKFYGLPDPAERKPEPQPIPEADSGIISLEDLIW